MHSDGGGNDVAQHDGHDPFNRTCNLSLWSIIDTCQNKVSTDQYYVTILWPQVLILSSSHCFFFKLTADQVPAF